MDWKWTGQRLHTVTQRQAHICQVTRDQNDEFRYGSQYINQTTGEQIRRFSLWAGEVDAHSQKYASPRPTTSVVRLQDGRWQPDYLIVTRRRVLFSDPPIILRTLEAIRGQNYPNKKLEAGHDPAKGTYYYTELLAIFDSTEPGEDRYLPVTSGEHESIFGTVPHYGQLTDAIKEMPLFAFIAHCEQVLVKIELSDITIS